MRELYGIWLHLNDAVKNCRGKNQCSYFSLLGSVSFPPISALVCFKEWIVQNCQVWRRVLKQMSAWWEWNSQFTYQQRGKWLPVTVTSFTEYESVLFRGSLKKGSTLLILVSGKAPQNKTQPTNQLFPPLPQYNSKLCDVSEFIINMDYKWYFPSPPPFLSKPFLMPGWGEE